MTRKDFKVIANVIKKLITDLKKNYSNFDSRKFEQHIFPDPYKVEPKENADREKLTRYQEGMDKHDYIDREDV